ncbi:MAG: 50S ribosomal protein L10 [Gammaproteobacteria bacterium]|nr:50S ribosomal protein L10 [Gammaproteobacteria bacterium]
MLTLESKKTIVAEVAEVVNKAQSVIAAEYRGLTVAEITELRGKAREAGVYLRIVRNTLARRAVEGTDYACIANSLSGPLMLAFSSEEPSAAARVLSDFAKEHDKLVVKIVALQGQLLNVSDLSVVAKLPTRDEAISQLMATMKAPVEKLVQTLAATPTKLVRTLVALKDQKEAA